MRDTLVVTVREAVCRDDLLAVWRLAHEVYVSEGYAEAQPDGLLRHYAHLDDSADTRVYLAEDANGRLLGTNSITIDGPAGLPVDKEFPELVESVRQRYLAQGLRAVSYWRLLTVPHLRSSLDVILRLLTATVPTLESDGIGGIMMIINPKHASFYERMTGGKPISNVRSAASVKGAPAVLLHGDVDNVLAHWYRVLKRRPSARLGAVRLDREELLIVESD